jgi:predicted Rossmann-fold nucleotide-binding protein
VSHTDEALGLTQGSQAAPTPITVGASPFSSKAPADGVVIVTGGTVSVIEIGRGGVFTTTGLTVGIVPVSRGDTVRVTYAVLPTMTFIRR